MKGLLAVLAIVLSLGIVLLNPGQGTPALLLCVALALPVGIVIYQSEYDKQFLLHVFVAGLLMRMLIGTTIFHFRLQEFFGGDALAYDELGYALLRLWQGEQHLKETIEHSVAGWGMLYIVASAYAVVGRNMLAIQFVSAVVGAATAPVISLCAYHIFRNRKVARLSALMVAFFPSLVLWSSQGLKDGFVIFLLAFTLLACLKLGDRFSVSYLLALVLGLLGVLTLRFYVFYMLVAAIGAGFAIGMRSLTAQSLLRQFTTVACLGLALTYFGVMKVASTQVSEFANLERVQLTRESLAQGAKSGFGQDLDVSTSEGALIALPVGMTYLLLAPFPWQVANLRQSITVPEILIWWAFIPLCVLGIWFTFKYRLRQALPILLFTMMLTLAYSLFQGNVGTAYRQRAQLLIFYFIFAAVGAVLLKEREDDRRRAARELLLADRAARLGRGRASTLR